ncbi:hypothetical protein GTA08_BOTSDO06470 [Botryosphaeria dothidea]|uniref:Uncharacterized protein n=1 Tax=Botryosphaeria dothidea TaxID=55169 RepID=A0A8H4IQG1_9PEZI|nr:hypothetical protein GTA08_BOTSDO06470 [Botryosphaeria dothidea]
MSNPQRSLLRAKIDAYKLERERADMILSSLETHLRRIRDEFPGSYDRVFTLVLRLDPHKPSPTDTRETKHPDETGALDRLRAALAPSKRKAADISGPSNSNGTLHPPKRQATPNPRGQAGPTVPFFGLGTPENPPTPGGPTESEGGVEDWELDALAQRTSEELEN